MPVGLGPGWYEPRGGAAPPRPAGPRGFHPGALWLAATLPLLATLALVVRLAA